MASSVKQDLLRQLPSIGDLLATPDAEAWLAEHPRALVATCVRQAVDDVRAGILGDTAGRCGTAHVSNDHLLAEAGRMLEERLEPHLRAAVNATGILLHTALGRSVWPEKVVDSMAEDLKGYVTLAIDRTSGKRSERDQRVEYLLCELTGAEAATVVNNNAAATMLVLAALAAEMEVVVSRGQLIEIGGAFRLPDVMRLSRAKMVEVGTTNRTHPRDYANALTEHTAVLMRVHPSNFRVVGFTGEVSLEELVELGRSRSVPVVDDLGAGALVDLAAFGLPHEPTVGESIAAGADVVLFSADKLIGAAQGGVIVGRADLIGRIRKHPLARAMRADKTCLMALERTLALFRDPELLRREHPLYVMLAADGPTLKRRARKLLAAIRKAAPGAELEVADDVGYLGSGSLPTEALPTAVVRLTVDGLSAGDLAERLRTDPACIFTRVDNEQVVLDVRTLWDHQIPQIATAVARAAETEE